MRKACAFCGDGFAAQRSTAKYCSRKCNVAASKARTRTALTSAPDGVAAVGTVASVRAELEAAGRVDTYLGSAALALAERIDRSTAVMGFAALVKELRSTMAAALSGAAVAADPLDELAARRDGKRAS
jgi:hypothetical protein